MSTTDAAPANPLDALDSAPAGGDQHTRLSLLREFGQHVDYSQQPTLSELPAIVSALIYRDVIGPVVAAGQEEHKTHAEVVQDVAHAIAPPDPNANATVYSGVDPAAHAQLQREVDELKAFVQELRGQNAELTPEPAPDPLADLRAQVAQLREDANAPEPEQKADALSHVADPRDAELLELRQQVERLHVQAATAQHPTGESEPLPDEPEAG